MVSNINTRFTVMKITYVIGDATQPQGTGNKIICHICNNVGAWGVGFVLALSKRWSYPEEHYRAQKTYPLGHVDILSVAQGDDSPIFVANMIGQHDIKPSEDGIPPIRYYAVVLALEKVNYIANEIGATLHAPKFGAGLAGGNWSIIESIIEEVITVPFTIYVLNENDLP